MYKVRHTDENKVIPTASLTFRTESHPTVKNFLTNSLFFSSFSLFTHTQIHSQTCLFSLHHLKKKVIELTLCNKKYFYVILFFFFFFPTLTDSLLQFFSLYFLTLCNKIYFYVICIYLPTLGDICIGLHYLRMEESPCAAGAVPDDRRPR